MVLDRIALLGRRIVLLYLNHGGGIAVLQVCLGSTFKHVLILLHLIARHVSRSSNFFIVWDLLIEVGQLMGLLDLSLHLISNISLLLVHLLKIMNGAVCFGVQVAPGRLGTGSLDEEERLLLLLLLELFIVSKHIVIMLLRVHLRIIKAVVCYLF